MMKKQRNKKKIYSKKRILRGGDELQKLKDDLSILLDKKMITLNNLILSSSTGCDFLKCLSYFSDFFNLCKNVLHVSIEEMEEELPIKLNILKEITELFQLLFIHIIPQMTSSELDEETGELDEETALLIGIQKPKLTTNFRCESLKLFDEFVNTLMFHINNEREQTIIVCKSAPPKRRLLLVLTNVDDSYVRLMKKCSIEAPEMTGYLLEFYKNKGSELLSEPMLRQIIKCYDFKGDDPIVLLGYVMGSGMYPTMKRLLMESGIKSGGYKSRRLSGYRYRCKETRKVSSKSKKLMRTHKYKHKKNIHRRRG